MVQIMLQLFPEVSAKAISHLHAQINPKRQNSSSHGHRSPFGVKATMIIKSRYLELNLPSVDIYTFLFKRKDKKFPDEHRKRLFPMNSLSI
jgi:hypothetical protein